MYFLSSHFIKWETGKHTDHLVWLALLCINWGVRIDGNLMIRITHISGLCYRSGYTVHWLFPITCSSFCTRDLWVQKPAVTNICFALSCLKVQEII